MRFRSRTQNIISSAWLVRVLAHRGAVHICTACAGRMFVPSRDGLCPLCRSEDHRRELAITQIVEEQLESAGEVH